jgi:hypothetical protein
MGQHGVPKESPEKQVWRVLSGGVLIIWPPVIRHKTETIELSVIAPSLLLKAAPLPVPPARAATRPWSGCQHLVGCLVSKESLCSPPWAGPLTMRTTVWALSRVICPGLSCGSVLWVLCQGAAETCVQVPVLGD